jgi:hypothetical protein
VTRAHARDEAECGSLARRCSGALLLLAIASLLVACGGGGGSESAQATTATLAWDAVVDPNLKGYRIYYGPAAGTYSQSLDVGDVTTYTVAGLSKGTRYYFSATAYESGNESTHSNEVFKDMP